MLISFSGTALWNARGLGDKYGPNNVGRKTAWPG